MAYPTPVDRFDVGDRVESAISPLAKGTVIRVLKQTHTMYRVRWDGGSRSGSVTSPINLRRAQEAPPSD